MSRLDRLRPTELIDLATDLSGWWATDAGRRYSANFGASERAKGNTSAMHQSAMHDALLANIEANSLFSATLFYVADNIVELLEREPMNAVEGLHWHEDELPTDNFFMWFDGNKLMRDIRGDGVAISGIHVTRILTAVARDIDRPKIVSATDEPINPDKHEHVEFIYFTTLYTDPSDPRDHMHSERRRGEIDKDFDVFDKSEFDGPTWRALPFSTWTASEGEPVAQHSTLTDANRAEIAGRYPDVDIDAAVDNIAAFVSFIADSIAIVQDEIPRQYAIKPDRAQRRRFQRKIKSKRPPDPVKLITLRRMKDADEGHADPSHIIDWSHRWIVRGHWRHIEDRDTGGRKKIWIKPYVKGPPDKPLLRKDEVFVVKR